MYVITVGGPQGSVLSLLLWNLMYDVVLRLPVADQAVVVGFADDVGVAIASNHSDEIKIYANETIWTVKSWLKDHGLELAEHKAKLALFTRWKQKIVEICIAEIPGSIFDSKVSFKPHLNLTGQKAATVSSTLARMLPNVGGPKYSRRLLLSRVVSIVLLHAAPVWASARKIGENRR